MPITLITGPANAGKAELVMEAVRRHVAHGAEPLLVVPRRVDVEHYRRELAGEEVCLGVAVLRFRELIGELVQRAGLAAPVLSTFARERALALLAAEYGHRGSPGFSRALAELIGELQLQRVTPRRFSEAIGGVGGSRAETELAELYGRYRALLEEAGYLDEEQRALQALDELRRKPALWGGRPVLLYGFDDLTPLQLDVIETLGARVDADVCVSLAYEPGRVAFGGRAGSFHALAPLAREHRALGARAEHYAPAARGALSHLERSLFEPQAARVDADEAVLLIEGSDEREELELVAEQVAELLNEGIEGGEIAVVTRATGAGADLLEEVFSSAAIPFSLRRRRRFADSSVGRALIGLLRCVPPTAGGAADGDARDLLAWLRAPGLLERAGFADRLEADLRRSGATSLEAARALWERRHWRLETIDHLHAAQQRSGAALAERAARELRWLFEAPRRRQASVLEADELDEGSALAAGQRALGELRELARANARLAPRSAGELAEALRAVHFGSGQHHTPRTVAVLDPLAPRARRVAALFVCGMQQGVFPVAARLGSLLSREQRMRLSEKSGLRLGEQQDPLAAERYLLYAAASRPQRRLVLSWHAGGDDGAAAARSLFIDDVCDVFESSLLAGRLRARSPLAASRRNGRRSTSCAVPTRSAPLPRAPADSRSGARERGGAIAPLRDQELLAELRARIWSASALECWMGCPVRWFVERMLRARDLDPEAEPLARGGLAHAALRQTLERLKRQTGSARLTPANLGAARELLAQALAEHGEDHPLSAAREREPALRRRLHADLERFLEHASGGCRERAAGAQERDEQSGRQQLEPGHLELEFGFGASDRGDGQQPASPCAGGSGDGAGAEPLPALDLGDGVMLRGRVDRVDVSADGRMAVVHDYKGRSASPAAKWLAGGELQVALYMRAVEQLLGAQAVGGFYQPLSGRDLRARGVLAREAEVELECVAPDRWEDADVRALLDAAATAAREVAVQARSGELHARPASCAWGGGCSYPTICRAEH